MKKEIDLLSMENVYNAVTVNYIEPLFYLYDSDAAELIQEVYKVVTLLFDLGLIDNRLKNKLIDAAQDDIVQGKIANIEYNAYDEMHHALKDTDKFINL